MILSCNYLCFPKDIKVNFIHTHASKEFATLLCPFRQMVMLLCSSNRLPLSDSFLSFCLLFRLVFMGIYFFCWCFHFWLLINLLIDSLNCRYLDVLWYARVQDGRGLGRQISEYEELANLTILRVVSWLSITPFLFTNAEHFGSNASLT